MAVPPPPQKPIVPPPLPVPPQNPNPPQTPQSNSLSNTSPELVGTPPPLSMSSIEESNLQQAWNILQTPSKVKDVNALRLFLDELGVTEAEELSFCEPQDIQQLSKHLKPVHSRSFLKLLEES